MEESISSNPEFHSYPRFITPRDEYDKVRNIKSQYVVKETEDYVNGCHTEYQYNLIEDLQQAHSAGVEEPGGLVKDDGGRGPGDNGFQPVSHFCGASHCALSSACVHHDALFDMHINNIHADIAVARNVPARTHGDRGFS
jgi:hypothetical protein